MQEIQTVRQLLLELLAERSPEHGARLKQRLLVAYDRRSLGSFAERDYGYTRFSDLLKATLDGVASVTRPDGGADIVVALVDPVDMKRPIISPAAHSQLRVRNDIWQAFSNPDAQRKRFLKVDSRQIVHFVPDQKSPQELEVQESPELFREIVPIPAVTQLAWMKEFIESPVIAPEAKRPLRSLAESQYSSELNYRFTNALAEHAQAWKRFRVERFADYIKQWLSRQDIDSAEFFEAVPVQKLMKPNPPVAGGTGPYRRLASTLLDQLSEDDIRNVVLPVLHTTVLVRSLS